MGDGPEGGKEWYLQVVDPGNQRHKICVKVAGRAYCLGFADNRPPHMQLRDANDPDAVIFNFMAPANIEGPDKENAVMQPWQQQMCTSDDGQASGHVRIDMAAFVEGRVDVAQVTSALQQGKKLCFCANPDKKEDPNACPVTGVNVDACPCGHWTHVFDKGTSTCVNSHCRAPCPSDPTSHVGFWSDLPGVTEPLRSRLRVWEMIGDAWDKCSPRTSRESCEGADKQCEWKDDSWCDIAQNVHDTAFLMYDVRYNLAWDSLYEHSGRCIEAGNDLAACRNETGCAAGPDAKALFDRRREMGKDAVAIPPCFVSLNTTMQILSYADDPINAGKCPQCSETRGRKMGVHCYASRDAFTRDPETPLYANKPPGYKCSGGQFTYEYTCGEAFDHTVKHLEFGADGCRYYQQLCCTQDHGSYYGGSAYDGSPGLPHSGGHHGSTMHYGSHYT